ncbi:DUF5694 domain-containing protein [Asaia sp. BMEF1]|uniref:DUF5694 domain-containing protein n=1 Tax=Asaia sp. BMEF1 TaxID=3155932 RepID=UPI003F66602A
MIRAVTIVLFLLMAVSHEGQAQPYHPSIRPYIAGSSPHGRHNEVLVLGTPHLSGLHDRFRPESLEPVLLRLAAWHPDAIATEDSSGLLCDALRHQGAEQASAAARYCPDSAPAGRVLGLSVVAANEDAERLLAALPSRPSPAQRRRLTLVFLAAGEPNSALVQWLRLSVMDRRAADGLTPDLVAQLTARMKRRNESGLIGAALAARLGLERVWSVDDQTSMGSMPDEKAYAAAVQKAWDNPATAARMAEEKVLYAQIDQPDGLLKLYRVFNAPAYAEQAYRSDWGAALAESSSQNYGRRYVGYWETRNLRMVANIRQVLARAPGTRLLAIVGASHKAYYEAYLDQMRDLDLIDVETVLE